MTFLGVDPGASGGFGTVGQLADAVAFKMPETERDIVDTLKKFKEWGQVFAVIEEVHSMPKQGVASSFKFGMSYGGLRMALIALEIPFRSVTPQKWQKELQCLSRGDKNVTKRRAQELFPKLKITHAVADAILLAEYCRRTHV